MNDAPDLAAVTAGPAEDLVEGRLRDGRQPRLHRRRGPGRGARHRPRRAGARRRLRQRQRRDRGGAAGLGQHGRRRLRPGPARARPRARRRRAARGRVRRGRRPGPALRGRRASTSSISIFGAMFAPDQQKTAAELLRVVKPGGRIGMANWIPDGGVGTMFMTIAKHAPPPPGRRLAAALGHRGAPARAVRRRRSPTCGSSAASRASRSAPPTTTSSSSAPTSARPRWPTNGSAPRAKQALTDDLRAFLEEANTGRRPGAGARGRVPAGDRDRAPERGGRARELASAAKTPDARAPIERATR